MTPQRAGFTILIQEQGADGRRGGSRPTTPRAPAGCTQSLRTDTPFTTPTCKVAENRWEMERGPTVSPENPFTPEGEADEYFCPVCGSGLAQSDFEKPERDYYCPFCSTRQTPSVL